MSKGQPVSHILQPMHASEFTSRPGMVWYVPVCVVGTICRSFHSWHATSHALQPMQVEVSMSFETTLRLRSSVFDPQTLADDCRTSNASAFMTLAPRPSRAGRGRS